MHIEFSLSTPSDFMLGISKYEGFQEDGTELQILDIGFLLFTISLYFTL